MNDKLEVWGSHLIEPGTVNQAYRTARLGVVEGVRLMPDAHVGKGATVGSVVATRDAIIPAAVGVDIGCGMAARRTDRARRSGCRPRRRQRTRRSLDGRAR